MVPARNSPEQFLYTLEKLLDTVHTPDLPQRVVIAEHVDAVHVGRAERFVVALDAMLVTGDIPKLHSAITADVVAIGGALQQKNITIFWYSSAPVLQLIVVLCGRRTPLRQDKHKPQRTLCAAKVLAQFSEAHSNHLFRERRVDLVESSECL